MASAALNAPAALGHPSRQEILDRYERLGKSGHEEVLGVRNGAEPAAVRAAFVALARRFHPDTLTATHSALHREIQAIFTRITEAYQSLAAAAATAPRTQSASERRPAASAVAASFYAPALTQAPPTPGLSIRGAGLEGAPTRPSGVIRLREPRERVADALREADAEIASGERERAVARLEQVLALASEADQRRIRLTLARVCASERRWHRRGVELLEGLLRADPWDPEALALLGNFFLRERLLVRAEGLLARAVLADPGNARARSDLREVREALTRRRTTDLEALSGRGLVARLIAIAR